MSNSEKPRVIVVGGGLAGLAATVRIAEAGTPGRPLLNGPGQALPQRLRPGRDQRLQQVARQQGYSEWQHIDETLYGGDFINHQPPVYEMAHWAPKVIDLLDRMGVPFNRTVEGKRDLRLFGGSLFKRTHFAGATTGQQLALRPRRADPPVGGAGQGQEVRVLGVPLARSSMTDSGRARASSPRTCGRWRSRRSPPTRWSWPPAATG